MLRVEREEPDQSALLLYESPISPPLASGTIFLAAVDRTLTVTVGGKLFVAGLPFQPPEPAIFADRPPDYSHVAHAGLGGRGPLRIGRVRIGRDVQFDPSGTFGGAQVFHLSANEFFVLGDNPPFSRDSRHYGAVDRSRILGVVRSRWGGWSWTERGWHRD